MQAMRGKRGRVMTPNVEEKGLVAQDPIRHWRSSYRSQVSESSNLQVGAAKTWGEFE